MKTNAVLWVALVCTSGLAAYLAFFGDKARVTEAEPAPGAGRANHRGKDPPSRAGEDERSPRAKAGPKGEGVLLPPDQGSRLLAEMLAPGRPPSEGMPGFADGPRPRPTPRSLEAPDLPLPPNVAQPPLPKVGRSEMPLRPPLAAAGAPLSWLRSDPVVPRRPKLPVAKSDRPPSPKSAEPVPLPFLGQPRPDKSLAEDPVAFLSFAAALAGKAAPRTTHAPFLKQNLSDPFDNRHSVKPRRLPKEDQLPENVGSAPPRR